MRKKDTGKDDGDIKTTESKENPEEGVALPADKKEDEKKKGAKTFGIEEKKTIKEKTTRLQLKKKIHGPSKEFAPIYNLKSAIFDTIEYINPSFLDIPDELKTWKEDLSYTPKIAEEGQIQ